MSDAPEPTGLKIASLRGGTIEAISSVDLDRKTALAQETATRWFGRRLSLRSPLDPPLPDRPGRPAKPELVPPKLVEKRSLHTVKGRIALLHAIAHIELNAVDLALDIVARYATEPVPHSFFDGWMQVAFEEAKHFRMVRERLRQLGADYGDMPAHDGLWQAAHATRNDLTARLAVVPLILEARGLDVTPRCRRRCARPVTLKRRRCSTSSTPMKRAMLRSAPNGSDSSAPGKSAIRRRPSSNWCGPTSAAR